MTKIRFLPVGVAVLVVVGMLSGCSRGPSEEELKLQQLQEDLGTLQEQHQVLQEARSDLVEAEATLAELEAVPERQRSDEQKAALTELPATIEGLNVSKDEAFESVQSILAPSTSSIVKATSCSAGHAPEAVKLNAAPMDAAAPGRREPIISMLSLIVTLRSEVVSTAVTEDASTTPLFRISTPSSTSSPASALPLSLPRLSPKPSSSTPIAPT